MRKNIAAVPVYRGRGVIPICIHVLSTDPVCGVAVDRGFSPQNAGREIGIDIWCINFIVPDNHMLNTIIFIYTCTAITNRILFWSH